MLQKQKVTKVVEEITGVTCDICGSDCCSDEDKIPEYMELKAEFGYGSENDGQIWTAQVCEECVGKHFSMVKFQVLDPEKERIEDIDTIKEMLEEQELLFNETTKPHFLLEINLLNFEMGISDKNYWAAIKSLEYLEDNFYNEEKVKQARELFDKTFN